MKDFKDKLKTYTELIVKVGINLKQGQPVVITGNAGEIEFIRLLVKAAYENGASKVYLELGDELVKKMKYEYATEEVLGQFPDWEVNKYEGYVKENAAFITVSTHNPELLKDIPSSKLRAAQKAAGERLKNYQKAISGFEVSWCIVSIPSQAWSQKVYPKLDEKEAMDKLWERIFEVNRINEKDPVASWNEHLDEIARRCDYLTKKQIKTLHYTAPGTDLYVELPEHHIWRGGRTLGKHGIAFVANMPTEEVFCMPHKYGVNGTLKATRPLIYAGNLIEDFSFVFKDGKIVSYDAAKGKELLEKLIHIDEGASYLGEVAIIPQSGLVSQSHTLFYNTLYDENATCHFAIGNCIPINLENGEQMTEDELVQKGGNTSLTHNDFMVGSEAMCIEAQTQTGEKFDVLKNGEWAF